MHTKSARQQEIEARLAVLDEQRRAAKEEGAKLVQELHVLLAEEQAQEWGLTADQYAAAKEAAYPDRTPRRELDAAQTRLARLTERAQDGRKPEAVRSAAAKEAKKLEKEVTRLHRSVQEAEGRRVPLPQALKAARRGELRPHQHVTARPADVSGAAQ